MKLTAPQRDALSLLSPTRAYRQAELRRMVGPHAIHSLLRADLLVWYRSVNGHDCYAVSEKGAKIINEWRATELVNAAWVRHQARVQDYCRIVVGREDVNYVHV